MSAWDRPAFPLQDETYASGAATGLTKREYAAIHIAAAIVAAPDTGDLSFGSVADRALKQADALFTGLEYGS